MNLFRAPDETAVHKVEANYRGGSLSCDRHRDIFLCVYYSVAEEDKAGNERDLLDPQEDRYLETVITDWEKYQEFRENLELVEVPLDEFYEDGPPSPDGMEVSGPALTYQSTVDPEEFEVTGYVDPRLTGGWITYLDRANVYRFSEYFIHCPAVLGLIEELKRLQYDSHETNVTKACHLAKTLGALKKFWH